MDALLHDPTLDVMALAIQRVREEHLAEVRNEAIQRYHKRERARLLEELRAEVEATEGEQLMAEAVRKLHADPKRIEKLRQSARTELIEKHQNRVQGTLAQEEEQHIAAEADRQLALDLFDMQFRTTGKVDLHDPALLSTLKAGDSLTLHMSDPDYDRRSTASMTFTWTEDVVSGGFGWLYAKTANGRFDLQDKVAKAKDRFCLVGSMMPNRQDGTQHFGQLLLVDTVPAVHIVGDGEPSSLRPEKISVMMIITAKLSMITILQI